MKNQLKAIFGLSALFFLTSAFVVAPSPNESRDAQEQDAKIELPENVKAIVEKKCMNCHKPDARNEKAKEKLQWVKVPQMNKEEQEHFVAEMFEVLEDGKMPPERMVERFPEMKLTEEETKTLLAWVEKEEKRLKGK
ncbi:MULTISPECIES: heme-binding domain-containing protein [Roseivirga]|jgi:ADP-heptose:LPS heptosyltransferase|uniref:heme-binding domain-containing protein n=1 Tax=Roseivirga TaxID=290180 RepID=UPI00257A5E15|nr:MULTISPECIES: heme-binding domain-containing protein [Roseivirga]MEC7754738.1 heme-binding domain-containing protein [Bacteroidota bacterium]|tara:strand:+ start:20 stop:430 length:411 start_codon:yes stop_codon:yes gene_type:complete